MENNIEEVERDFIEFRKEMEEEEHTKNEKQLPKNQVFAGNGELTVKE
jgi:hypothetical protein